MLSQVLLFGMVVTSVIANETPRLTCDKVTPLKTIQFSQLTGGWVGVRTIQFKDGRPFRPDNDPTPHVCIHGHTHDVSEQGFKVTMDTIIPGREPTKEEVVLSVVGDNQGRLSAKSSIKNRENFEFLVVADEPTKYLIYLICLPPNEKGERLPTRANLLSRHGDHSDIIAITDKEIEALEHRFSEKVGLSGNPIKPTSFSKACWTNYGKNE